MKRVAKHKRSAGLGRRHAGQAAKRCLRATAANLGATDCCAGSRAFRRFWISENPFFHSTFQTISFSCLVFRHLAAPVCFLNRGGEVSVCLPVFRCYTLPEIQAREVRNRAFRKSHSGGQDQLYRHVRRVLRAGRSADRASELVGFLHWRCDRNHAHCLWDCEAAGLFFQGPVPAGLSV